MDEQDLPDDIQAERARRRREAHREQMSAPSYWSSHGAGQWILAGIVLVILIVVIASL